MADGSEFDGGFGPEYQYDALFWDAVSHSDYEDNRDVVDDAREMFIQGFILDDVDPDWRESARDIFFELLDIEREDFDWEYWKMIHGYE